MRNHYSLFLAVGALAASLIFPGISHADQAAKQTSAKSATKAVAAPAPGDKEIADARSKGLVWVNISTKVYHKDGQFYGKTKQGKFMTEDDAKKAGYRAAKEPVAAKKPSPGKK
jgi:hypothetical protein